MREILFRGKDNGVLNGVWQYGSLDISNPDVPEINRIDRYNNKMRVPIIIETVGQYTGLTDKNGKKIFEGDILTDNPNSKIANIYEIVWYEELAGFMLDDGLELYGTYDWIECHGENKILLEVIGNIHDNPELLKGERYGTIY